MRLPRDLSGDELVLRLEKFGYHITRQRGSHIRLSRVTHEGTHHLTIPRHNPLRVGTLNGILNDVASHLGMSKDELLAQLFQS
ncbi:type II toxin-antitoxin system HicA family toxin [Litorilinea aerophila]|uniref:Type II toxin-antitoxin system HicA family toxin n=1 Tax=Litorilinea aerophila TaxID=1204385 RepID=A0A540VGB0_9CHLR